MTSRKPRSSWSRLRAANAALHEPQVWALYVLAFLVTAVWALGAPSGSCRGCRRASADRAGVLSMLEGFRFVRRRPVILGILLLDTNAMVFGMPSALFPAFAQHRYGGGARSSGCSTRPRTPARSCRRPDQRGIPRRPC